jgi:hypothetical protein
MQQMGGNFELENVHLLPQFEQITPPLIHSYFFREISGAQWRLKMTVTCR